MRWYFNAHPTYFCSGGTVEYIASDWREARVRIDLGLRTRNYVGTIYGGSMYAAVDPFYMIMLIKLLGPDYVVWDKGASIRFRKPGRETLYATFRVEQAEVEEIRALLDAQKSVDRTYQVELVNRAGIVHAVVDKVVYVAKKREAGEGRGG
ncbi:MAG: hypothetical protein GMKNLPBB_02071 [Myxococcota bacterium]|nr:hypothetical protein [Myxococcota bacterium]